MADNVTKETFTLILTYEMSVNTDTGEVLETRLIDRSVDKSDVKSSKPKKKVVEEKEDTEPKLFLEDNKFKLNSAALKLMEISAESGAKLDIKYEDNGGKSTPVLGTDEVFGTKGGNKLTKTNTVAFRGVKNEELSKYGKEFTLMPYNGKPGLFVLSSEEQAQEEPKDEDISVDVEDTDLPFDLDLEALAEDKDANITEIDSTFFNLNV